MAELLQCVSCHRGDRRGKLLRCLHVLCAGCAPQHLTPGNEVLCPGCSHFTLSQHAGKQQLMNLPNVSCSSRTDQKLYCGECVGDTEAVSSCLDCCELLCDGHAKLHPVSRSSHNHRLRPIHGSADGSGNPKLCAKFCTSHAGHELQAFCMECKLLMCELCERSVTNHKSSHSTLPVDRAQKEMRRKLKEQLAAFTAQKEGAVTRAAEKVGATIQQLHDRTEAVSERVMEYFDGALKAMEARRDQVLDDLEQLRHAKLVPLQDQKCGLERSAEMTKAAAALLDGCEDSWNFLQLSGIVEEAVKAATAASNGDLAPCVQSNLMFEERAKDKLWSAMKQTGLVIDAGDMDFQSVLDCPPILRLGNELTILVKRCGVGKLTLTNAAAARSSLTLEVMEGDGSTKRPLAVHSDKMSFVTKYRPKLAGELHVIAKYDGRHLVGSPVRVGTLRPNITLVPVDTRGHVQLSFGGEVAECGAILYTGTGTQINGLACSSSSVKDGLVEFKIRLCELQDGNIDIFFSKPRYPDELKKLRGDWESILSRDTFGWCASTTSQRVAGLRSSGLGQPWKSGDLLNLTVDCRQHTLHAQHDRTNATDTVADLPDEVLLFIQMTAQKQKVLVSST